MYNIKDLRHTRPKIIQPYGNAPKIHTKVHILQIHILACLVDVLSLAPIDFLDYVLHIEMVYCNRKFVIEICMQSGVT